ncbi:hypothetical protein POJ06DRAFT_254862 [Lipomyces tetrasporus]|uniref:Uncharacterized protein n=1 Tax=Lipomyces tetrasporus TaxID=54092 RepID=A0AAD7VSN6_9ASCO|nr:uncharacterized protein POJ06DRAFT_254862 [Lipomyces tetrasporus]KAJ8099909.1 hypothetical protein POJ06DRAFT_254862 [Lipomyces tetrasporus]
MWFGRHCVWDIMLWCPILCWLWLMGWCVLFLKYRVSGSFACFCVLLVSCTLYLVAIYLNV